MYSMMIITVKIVLYNWCCLREWNLPVFASKNKSKHVSDIGLFSSVQLLSHVRLFMTPWTAARQASLSTTNFVFGWFWYQGDGGLVEWAWKCSFLCNFLKEF